MSISNMDAGGEFQLVSAIVPVDLQTGANNGDWVCMKNYDRLTVIVFKGIGTAGDDPVLTMAQATDVAGTGVKALTFTRIWAKVGTQTGLGTFTLVTQAAASTYTDAVSAEAQALWMIEIEAGDLDRANGFDCVRFNIPDVGGNAQIGCALYLLRNSRYLPPLSAIID